MAARGVNGAAAETLNERFIKCAGCKVNIPKEDMLSLGKCTVCGRAYERAGTSDDAAVVVQTVPFATGATASGRVAAVASDKPKRKRWATLTSKRGRTYYHNTETGEDTWEKPADFDADAVENDGFVPFKNDTVKNAVLREQAKMDATKMGLPADVIESFQQQQRDDEQDPFGGMLNRPAAQTAKSSESLNEPSRKKAPNRGHNNGTIHEHGDEEEEEEEDEEEDDDVASSPSSVDSPAKQGSCMVM